jgi:bifunctional ADP-heptose synthase (sugar kinase/adenylyltransferase)
MILFEKNGNISSIPTIARQVADVSGAGDTVIATLAAMFVSGATLWESSIIANFASGVVCEKPGIVAIERNELIETAKRYL